MPARSRRGDGHTYLLHIWAPWPPRSVGRPDDGPSVSRASLCPTRRRAVRFVARLVGSAGGDVRGTCVRSRVRLLTPRRHSGRRHSTFVHAVHGGKQSNRPFRMQCADVAFRANFAHAFRATCSEPADPRLTMLVSPSSASKSGGGLYGPPAAALARTTDCTLHFLAVFT